MRRYFCSHSDRNTVWAVDQQMRYTRRKHYRFLSAFIKVRHKVNCLFVNIGQHIERKLRHSCLSISVCCGAVAIDWAEISVSVNSWVTHWKILRHTYHCVIYRRITVRMISSQNISDSGRTLSIRLVRSYSVLIHCIKYSSVNRL